MDKVFTFHISKVLFSDKEIQGFALNLRIIPILCNDEIETLEFLIEEKERIVMNKNDFLTSKFYYHYFDKVCAHQVSLSSECFAHQI